MRLTALLAVLALTLILASCGGSGSSPPATEYFTAKGTLACAGVVVTKVAEGTKVTVVSGDHKTIGSGSLSGPTLVTTLASQEQHYSFSARVPDGESKYGIEVQGLQGTTWFRVTEMRKGPQIDASC